MGGFVLLIIFRNCYYTNYIVLGLSELGYNLFSCRRGFVKLVVGCSLFYSALMICLGKFIDSADLFFYNLNYQVVGVSGSSSMTQRNMMTGFDMEQHSLPDIPPMNPVPTFEPYDNNSMFPHYHPHPHHHHPQQQGASNLGPVMSTPPNLYLPYEPFHTPPNHPSAPESTPHFMGHGYKRKSAEAIPGNYQYLTEAAPPCSFPYYSTTTYPQPIDQRSVRSRVGADPPPYYPHGHDSFFQGSYAAHPVPPPGPIWYDQHCNGNTSDGPPSLWLQPPSVPFMHGNIFYSGLSVSS